MCHVLLITMIPSECWIIHNTGKLSEHEENSPQIQHAHMKALGEHKRQFTYRYKCNTIQMHLVLTLVTHLMATAKC